MAKEEVCVWHLHSPELGLLTPIVVHADHVADLLEFAETCSLLCLRYSV